MERIQHVYADGQGQGVAANEEKAGRRKYASYHG